MSTAAQQVPPPGGLFLDHVAHFVPDLGAATRTLEALGFAVTPPSVRPWPDRLANAARRTVYRLAYPLVRLWWWLRAPRHEGARASGAGRRRRRAYGFPGGQNAMKWYGRWLKIGVFWHKTVIGERQADNTFRRPPSQFLP